jgi:cytochrome c553
MHRASIALIVGLLSLAPATTALAGGDASAGRAKAKACVPCHGPNGNNVSATIPRLAGQVPEYLKKQMQDFRNGYRGNCGSFRAGVPAPSDADIADIAAFFASQPVATMRRASYSTPLGESLYFKGRRSPVFMPACTGCHGPAGGGKSNWQQVMSVPPAILPSSIGGQSAPYIVSQLEAFRAGNRTNDVGAVMRHLAAQMSDEDIAAVATYVAGLQE